jgi:hypothetical protein
MTIPTTAVTNRYGDVIGYRNPVCLVVAVVENGELIGFQTEHRVYGKSQPMNLDVAMGCADRANGHAAWDAKIAAGWDPRSDTSVADYWAQDPFVRRINRMWRDARRGTLGAQQDAQRDAQREATR